MASEILDIPQLENRPEKEIRKDLKKYEKLIRKMLIIWEKGTSMRARNKWRLQLKEFKKKREEQRKIPQEVKKYYNYALKRPTQAEKPEVLFDNEEIWTTKKKYTKKKSNS